MAKKTKSRKKSKSRDKSKSPDMMKDHNKIKSRGKSKSLGKTKSTGRNTSADNRDSSDTSIRRTFQFLGVFTLAFLGYRYAVFNTLCRTSFWQDNYAYSPLSVSGSTILWQIIPLILAMAIGFKSLDVLSKTSAPNNSKAFRTVLPTVLAFIGCAYLTFNVFYFFRCQSLGKSWSESIGPTLKRPSIDSTLESATSISSITPITCFDPDGEHLGTCAIDSARIPLTSRSLNQRPYLNNSERAFIALEAGKLSKTHKDDWFDIYNSYKHKLTKSSLDTIYKKMMGSHMLLNASNISSGCIVEYSTPTSDWIYVYVEQSVGSDNYNVHEFVFPANSTKAWFFENNLRHVSYHYNRADKEQG